MNNMKTNPRWLAALMVAAMFWLHPALAAGTPPLMLGSSWYPEQWPEAQWEGDLAKMQAAGIS